MPFNFQLLIEFFFSGLITMVSIMLFFGVIDPTKAKDVLDTLKVASPTQILIIVFIGGLISYYLGTVINALSNKIIRERFTGYRIKMIRRKLGLQNPKKTEIKNLDKIETERLVLIKSLLPVFATTKEEDKLKELYTAARNFCGIYSEQTNHMVSYHWGLLRLSRATIFPLFLLCLVLIIRLVFLKFNTVELFSLGFVIAALALTLVSYLYREKFLIYTVFDIFFISQKTSKKADNFITST